MLKDSDKTAVGHKVANEQDATAKKSAVKRTQAEKDGYLPGTQPGEANENGEKTNGTTKDGSTAPVKNTTSVPQNGVTEVETTDAPNDIAKEADEARTEDEVKFADESNPNQKARYQGAHGDELDQDGNQRTGGYSYGVAEDDPTGTVPEEYNRGQTQDGQKGEPVESVRYEHAEHRDFLNDPRANSREWTLDEQRKLEDTLSDESAGVTARVSTSAGDYVRVKFFHNNKPMGTYTSRKFSQSEATKFLKELRKDRNV